MNEKEDINGSFPPWSRIPSLSEMADEAGVDTVEFLNSIQLGMEVTDLAEKFRISQSTAECLYEHFYRYGVNTIMGGD